MRMDEYQSLASSTDQLASNQGTGANRKEILVPLLGLSGEVGELLSEYKKFLRDEQGHGLFIERVREELGDILWYLTNVATKFDLGLEQVARWNLEKVSARWGPSSESQNSFRFDADYPENERLPRKFAVTMTDDGEGTVHTFSNDTRLGHRLSDNRYIDDGYRFHDVFHFGYAAVLGWSPITRWMLKCKRKSNPRTDEVEDGGRAIAIEEGISAMVFSYAEQHDYFARNHWVSTELLRTIKSMTAHLEVSRCTIGDWERAIRTGFDAWRAVRDMGAAHLAIDLDGRVVDVVPTEEKSTAGLTKNRASHER